MAEATTTDDSANRGTTTVSLDTIPGSANTGTTTETTTEETDSAVELSAMKDTNSSLMALIKHLSPELDIDKALDDFAYKRDGTPVYIGETLVKEETAPAAKPVQRRPSNQRIANARPKASALNDNDLLGSIAVNGMKTYSA